MLSSLQEVTCIEASLLLIIRCVMCAAISSCGVTSAGVHLPSALCAEIELLVERRLQCVMSFSWWRHVKLHTFKVELLGLYSVRDEVA